MSMLRMDHVGLIVEDLEAAIAFFEALGLQVEGRAAVGGEWAERVTGLPGMRTTIAMLATPDGSGRIEVGAFDTPSAVGADRPRDEPHAIGYRSVMFEVEDLDEAVAGLAAHGATLIGEPATYEDTYRMCYLRGPEGIIVALAEQVSAATGR